MMGDGAVCIGDVGVRGRTQKTGRCTEIEEPLQVLGGVIAGSDSGLIVLRQMNGLAGFGDLTEGRGFNAIDPGGASEHDIESRIALVDRVGNI